MSMTAEQIKAEIERLKAEHKKLLAAKPLSLKVSDKGALSVYGMGRFPVTLYPDQFLRILGMAEEIRQFIHANTEAFAAQAYVHAQNEADRLKRGVAK